MDDGYKHGNGIVLCTDNFTLSGVNLLIKALESNFGLKCTIHVRKQICWRIFISGEKENAKKLRSLVLPYFIPSMLYKLELTITVKT